MSAECPICGQEFGSKRGVNSHKAQKHNRMEPWHDETTMRYLYEKKRLSTSEIAEILPCNRGNVKRWLRKHGIEMRSPSEAAKLRKLREPPHHRWHNGYEQVVTGVDGGQEGVQIHRLVAVAEYGIEAVKGKVVHHDNGVKWDNRPYNLEMMDNAEHTRYHNQRGDLRHGAQP